MQRLNIQNKILDVVAASHFYQVTYNDSTKKAVPYDNTAPDLKPSSARTNEVSCKFVEDKEYGLDRIWKKAGWIFILFLDFNVEVDLDPFEKAWMEHLPFIDPTGTEQSVTLLLLDKTVSHGVQQDSATGTGVKYLIQAELGRN